MLHYQGRDQVGRELAIGPPDRGQKGYHGGLAPAHAGASSRVVVMRPGGIAPAAFNTLTW